MTDERENEGMGEDEARAVRALDEAERADAPPGLLGAVMDAVRARGTSRRQLPSGWRVFKFRDTGFRSPGFRRHDSISGGSMSTSKKVLLGVAAAAVIAIGFFAVQGYPPVGSGAEGTVGAARRYQSEQITAKDVVLQDPEVQAFMQSDTFDRLIKDRASRKLLASETFRQALANQSVQQVLSNQSLLQVLSSQSVLQVLSSQEFAKALSNQEFAKALQSQEFAKALSNQEFAKALQSQDFLKALRSQEFQNALQSQAFQEAVSSPAFQNALQSQALQQALSSRAFQASLASREAAN